MKNNEEVVGVLLAAKADVNLKHSDSGYTALHYAALLNAGLSVVTKLIEAKAVNAVDNNNATALHELSNWGNGVYWAGDDDGLNKDRIAMADHLLAHGAQPSLTIKNKQVSAMRERSRVSYLFFLLIPASPRVELYVCTLRYRCC